jgi:hypothetical protein
MIWQLLLIYLGQKMQSLKTLLSLASCKLHSLQRQTFVFHLVPEWELTQTAPFKLIAQLLLLKGAQQLCALVEKSLINMIWLLLSVSDLSIIMIGPGGLLLVVSHLFAISVLVWWVGLQKKVYNYTWMWKTFLQDHILSTARDALMACIFP